VWLLGSSDYSARLAASKGLPYVFAHHFSGQGTAEALELYRSTFRPSDVLAEPRTFLTVNAVAADTTELAQRQALPQLLAMLSLRTGGPLEPQASIEEAEAAVIAEAHRPLLESMKQRWVIGSADEAAAQVRELARVFDVDEVMVNPAGGALAGTAADRTPAKEDTVRLLAERLLS